MRGSVDAALNLEVDENADLAARMDVGNGGVLVEALEAADLQVFADGHDLLGKHLGDLELGAGVLAVHQSVNISGVVLQRRPWQISLTNSTNGADFAQKSVSQLTSTTAPTPHFSQTVA